ncbi:carbohydrate kinase family protein [Edaphobacter albus]|uniref:carbohydrate kinase family protein n=1 Tax=Edaphobacter sp. 4G125 TaxID=2763071 RepID=UPI001647F4C2|nr:PfkB family carbohydrate kinase [Edaphobacter sp. 4G125]QNI37471.1 hypothetical protein H7846_03975 [Edaphobacter sp. 4G125]
MTKSYDVLAIGVAAVDDLMYISSYPPPNAKVPVSQKERHGGGPACTAIVSVAMLHGRTAFCARLGEDELSLYIKQQLQQHHVDTAHIVHDPSAVPYHSAIAVDLAGNRNVFYSASCFKEITPEDLSEDLVLSSKVVLLDHVSGLPLTGVAQKIRALGIPIIGDIEGCSEESKQLADLVDYLVVPSEFAQWVSNARDPREACAYLAQTKRTATVITAGQEGCYYLQGGSSSITHLPAFRIKAFDTNGCGDTFHGAFALAIARNFSLDDALLFASAAAAVKAVGKNGTMRGWDALPTLEDIIQLLRASSKQFEVSLLERIARIAE